MLGPRQEELLSYLTGMAPVGEPFRFAPKHIMKDLGFNNRETTYRLLWRLCDQGCVERVDYGDARWPGRVRVLRRLEAVA